MNTNRFYQLADNAFPDLSALQLSLIAVMATLPIADFLLYQGEKIGITLAIFLLVMGLVSFVSQSKSRQSKNWKLSSILLILGLLPIVETLNALSVIIGIIATLSSIILFNPQRRIGNISALAYQLVWTIALMPVRPFKDARRLNQIRDNLSAKAQGTRFIKNWLFPILLTCGFLWLFSLANPIILGWLESIDLLYLLGFLDIDRITFWTVMAMICWPLIRVKVRKQLSPDDQKKKKAKQSDTERNGLFNEPQVFRALLLFNLLFAIQTFLDVFYLWGGGQLPQGVTYSQYVHRGTYILLVTALLAALFILFVTSKKYAMEQSAQIRLLLLVWTGQNIFLVVSTMMRMELYVEAYALTYLRVSALIWIFLVMMGLGLIIIRLLRGYTNGWLVNANLISLAVTLYIVSFANMPYLIGSYNVSTAIDNPGKRLDVHYLGSLGENIIPVIDRILNQPNGSENKHFNFRWYTVTPYKFEHRRNQLSDEAENRYKDWRQWSFRRLRLVKYLEKKEYYDQDSSR